MGILLLTPGIRSGCLEPGRQRKPALLNHMQNECKAKQSKAKQNKAKQNKAKQSKAKQSKQT